MKWVIRLLGGVVGLVLLAVLILLVLGRRPHAGETRVAVEIARPPEVVWAWIDEPERLKQWVSWLAEIRSDTPGVVGVGARERWIMDDPNMRQRLEIPAAVTEYDPPHRSSVHIDAPKMFVGDLTYTLTPIAGGTRLEQVGQWRYADPFARLMEPLVTPEANKKGRLDFAKLKALAEAR